MIRKFASYFHKLQKPPEKEDNLMFNLVLGSVVAYATSKVGYYILETLFGKTKQSK